MTKDGQKGTNKKGTVVDDTADDDESSTGIIIAVVVGVGALIIICVVVNCFVFRKSRENNKIAEEMQMMGQYQTAGNMTMTTSHSNEMSKTAGDEKVTAYEGDDSNNQSD